MPKITIINLFNKSVDLPEGTTSILNGLHENSIDWMHACGAKGRCTTCKMVVINGMEQLSEVNEQEQKFKELGKLADNERLACQCTTQGDIEVAIPESSKMPHMNYSK